MQRIPLYRFVRPDGGVTTSPVEPEGPYTLEYRLVADEWKALTTDGCNLVYCVDETDADGWYEVDDPETEQGDDATPWP